MSEIFGFDLPDKSKELTDKEYVNLVNRIRGNFLSYVAILDSTLTIIISDLFLRDKNDFSLWTKTVFDKDRTLILKYLKKLEKLARKTRKG